MCFNTLLRPFLTKGKLSLSGKLVSTETLLSDSAQFLGKIGAGRT